MSEEYAADFLSLKKYSPLRFMCRGVCFFGEIETSAEMPFDFANQHISTNSRTILRIPMKISCGLASHM